MEWCLAHPWLTFFLALILVEETARTVRSFVTWRQLRADDRKELTP